MRFYIVLTFLYLPCTVFSQNGNWIFKNAIDSLIASQSIPPGEPGIGVCISRGNQILYQSQMGLANVNEKIPIGPETMFNIGSVTKQFTAACLLLLEEQNLLNLGDSIQKFIPELPCFGHKVTLHHLMTHTSGLFDHFNALNMRSKYKDSHSTLSTIVDFYQKNPVTSFTPGSYFLYNNTAYMLLNTVIERVSGVGTEVFMKTHIFEPLGMKHTSFNRNEQIGIWDKTTSYQYLPGKKKYKKHKVSVNATGATGVHSTLRDMVLWQNNFTNNQLGQKDPEFIQKMEKTGYLNDGNPIHYGAGLLLKNFKGLPTVEHGGGWNSFLFQCRRFTETNLNVLVMSNNDHTNPFSIADAICNRIMHFQEVQTGIFNPYPQMFPNLEGAYMSPNNHIRLVSKHGDTLKIQIYEAAKSDKIPLFFQYANDTSIHFLDGKTGYPVVFHVNAHQEIIGFEWEGGEYFQCARFFSKIHEKNINPQFWSGKYKTANLKTLGWFSRKPSVRIRYNKRKKELRFKPFLFISYPLQPISGNVYKIKDDVVYLRFSETGIILGDDWIMNIAFDRVR